MPHGGYHGVVKVGNTIVQQGSPAGAPPGQGGQYNPDGYATEMAGSSAPAQNNQTAAQVEQQINQAIADQKDKEFDDKRAGVLAINAQQKLLSDLLRREQEEALRNRIIAQARPVEQVDIDQGFGITRPAKLNRSDLLGYEGGLFGINTGPNIGGTTYPIAAQTVNPFTGEKIITRKAREGLTTPQYNEFIANLYDANPELFEEQFPVASGQALKPLIARILEGDLGKLAGNVGSGIGSFIDSATGAIFKPRGGTVRPSDGVPAPGAVGLGIGSPETFPKKDVSERKLPLFGQVPDQFREGFLKFYYDYEGPKAGGMAITPVKLPDGSVIEFGDTATAAIFREYLDSIGVMQPESTEDFKKVESRPTGISKFDVDKFYASLPQYTQQGIMAPVNLSRFTDALRMFPGATV